MAAPRMTRADAWKGRKCVQEYFIFKNELLKQARGWQPDDSGQMIVFYLPMPVSWSDKKKKSFWGNPHQNKPDLDNLLKAFYDSLKEKDQTVFTMEAYKYWWDYPHIEVYSVEPRKI